MTSLYPNVQNIPSAPPQQEIPYPTQVNNNLPTSNNYPGYYASSDAVVPPPQLSEDDLLPRELRWLETYKYYMEDCFKIPLLPKRFGWNIIVNLIPGIGDLLSLGFTLTLIFVIMHYGISVNIGYKMFRIAAISFLVGLIPLFGDIFVYFYKPNSKIWKMFKEYYKSKQYREMALQKRQKKHRPDAIRVHP
ncbi:hypothetical protein ABK040_009264 [Willaertia magna]